MDRFHLFRRHSRKMPAPLVGLEQHLVGNDVELLLHLTLDVLAAQTAEHTAKRAFAYRMADRLARPCHDFDQKTELRLQCSSLTLLFDQELRQGLALHVTTAR
jgi:hypothetical protein